MLTAFLTGQFAAMDWPDGDTVTGSLTVDGPADFGDTVDVTGAATFASTTEFDGVATFDSTLRTRGANGQLGTFGTVTSNVTLNTGGVTSTGPAIPAGAQVLDVTARVTTTITTATDWSVGVGGATTRYVNANATLAAGTTALGIDNPRKYTSATDTVITTTGTPGAGAIRITIHYFLATAATS